MPSFTIWLISLLRSVSGSIGRRPISGFGREGTFRCAAWLVERFFDGLNHFFRFGAGEASEAIEEDAFAGKEEFVEVPANFSRVGRFWTG